MDHPQTDHEYDLLYSQLSVPPMPHCLNDLLRLPRLLNYRL